MDSKWPNGTQLAQKGPYQYSMVIILCPNLNYLGAIQTLMGPQKMDKWAPKSNSVYGEL